MGSMRLFAPGFTLRSASPSDFKRSQAAQCGSPSRVLTKPSSVIHAQRLPLSLTHPPTLPQSCEPTRLVALSSLGLPSHPALTYSSYFIESIDFGVCLPPSHDELLES